MPDNELTWHPLPTLVSSGPSQASQVLPKASIKDGFSSPVRSEISGLFSSSSLDWRNASASIGSGGVTSSIRPSSLVSDTLLTVPTLPFSATGGRILQMWEGRVVRIETGQFVAVVKDVTDPRNPDEEVVLQLDEVDPDDLNLITPGAEFYWTISYEEPQGKPRRRVTKIRPRRLARWSKRDVAEAERFAASVDVFGDDEPSPR